MTVHKLKTWPEFYEAIVSGAKTFEVRAKDRDFKVGDTLELLEWKPAPGMVGISNPLPTVGEHTGRSVTREITYIMAWGEGRHFGVEPGWVVLALKPL